MYFTLQIMVQFSRNNKEVKEKLLFSNNLPTDNSIYLLLINFYNGIAIVGAGVDLLEFAP